MKALWCFLLTAAPLTAGAYVPGTPGAPWTKDELLTVKAKLYREFRADFLPPKMLRLGFHDCLKYADGTGGCDGCLNWHGVGERFDPGWVSRSAPDVNVTNNNGLAHAVDILESIYTDPRYPYGAPVLGQSLRDLGKSRADLWAYASMVAVEFGIEVNNIACENNKEPRVKQPTCIHDPSTCQVTPSRTFRFESGRADCTEHDANDTYKATKEEHHPSPLSNGKDTIKFFKDDFDFTGRETAAIFGAHTYGKPHLAISLFPYTWTSSAIFVFNNDYYKSIVGQDRWYFDDPDCNAVGDAFGNRPKTRWFAHARMITKNGGPIFWIKENLVCPNRAKYDKLNDYDKKCLDEAEPGMTCRADSPSGSNLPRNSSQPDGNGNGGCEKYRLISGRDEVALNCEMGLYKEFEVEDGIIYGCPGLEHFNASMRDPNFKQIVNSRLPGEGRAEPLCERQRLAEPPGAQPLYQIMEEYANDQTTWINDYITTHEKMLRNGYGNALVGAPDHSTNVICRIPNIWGGETTHCYERSEAVGPRFKISDRWTDMNADRVLEVDQQSGKILMQPTSDDATQLWQRSASGDQLINVGTGTPFILQGNAAWKIEQDGDDIFLIEKLTGRAIDTWPTQSNNPPTLNTKHGAPWQSFQFIFQ